MKVFRFLIIVSAALVLNAASLLATQDAVAERIAAAKDRKHPYLLFPAGTEQEVRAKIEAVPLYSEAYANLLALADKYAELPPVEYKMEGRRLLTVSREFLRRVEYLAFAYRMSGEEKYLKGAEKEMLAVAAFPSWNPSHFLDVGEMATGMAIGYDWLYNELSPSVREKIRVALLEKAIGPGLAGGRWTRASSNWNQVCNAGMVMAALAVMGDHPKEAATLVSRSVENLPIALAQYEPEGVYPEGPSYWGYGTGYTAIMLEALQTALGDTFGIKENNPGFMQTADYYVQVCGPTGGQFNYGDGNLGRFPLEAIPWFAKTLDRPDLMWLMQDRIRIHIDEGGSWKNYPLVLLWAPPLEQMDAPSQKHWHGTGEVPVSIHRSGWDPRATFFGTRAGKGRASHAHMDIGSFVLEADGVRWVVDSGFQDYNALEQLGLKIWDRSQNGDRWKVFGNNNYSHNTLTVNGQLQNVDAEAKFLEVSTDPENPFTLVDMSEVYGGQLDRAVRGLRLVDGNALLVQDEVEAPVWRPSTNVRWAITTEAEIEINGQHARLTQGGESLDLYLDGPEGAQFVLFEQGVAPAPYDKWPARMKQLGFFVDLEPGEKAQWRVFFRPGDNAQALATDAVPLSEWGAK